MADEQCCDSRFHWHKFREPTMVVALVFFLGYVVLITVGQLISPVAYAAGWLCWGVAMTILIRRWWKSR